MDQEKKDFFISYTGADQQWAEWIAWILEDAGYTTVLQAWDFHAGSNFVQDMQTALEKAQRLLLFFRHDICNQRTHGLNGLLFLLKTPQEKKEYSFLFASTL